MRLKRLELQGYKTFATRTDFAFDDGITAIVGPNGTGKSNCADAIRWVLGEQSYRVLRGKSTEDMIFAGSAQRARLGMASASLTFDNSDGWLPVDFGEVTLTRRAYRSGENEYLLNGSRVRLRDINELLAKSGLARRTYTVIGQGLVDAVLSLRPEERRTLFEEAAGITLYQSKRADALARLDETHANLLRVNDIVNEIVPRLRRLEREAERAERHAMLSQAAGRAAAHLVRLSLAPRAVGAAPHPRRVGAPPGGAGPPPRGARRAGCADGRAARPPRRAAQAAGRLAPGKRRSAAAAGGGAAQPGGVAGADAAAGRPGGRASGRDGGDRVTGRVDGRADRPGRKGGGRLPGGAPGPRGAGGPGTGRAGRSGGTADRAGPPACRRPRPAFSTWPARQADARNRLGQIDERRGTLAGDRTAHQAAAAAHETQAAELGRQMETLAAQQAQVQAEGKALAAEGARLDAALVESQSRQAELRTALGEAQRQAERLQARSDLLARLRAEGEGLHAGVRAVLAVSGEAAGGAERGARDTLSGILGTVAQLVQVPAEYEVAIEVALGGHLQDVVVESWPEAEAAVAYLKAGERGRATFLPLDTVRSGSRLEVPQDLKGAVVGVAADLVGAEARLAPAVEMLLGRTVVVRELKAARRVFERLAGGFRL